MENLVRHTTNLVARHNCVIIPGLGAFLAHNVPASYSAEDGVFMPPHRSLGFNAQIVVDDALLQTEYMENGKFSFEDAGKTLSNDAAMLRSQLSKGGVVRFGELGTFSMNINGEISFTPSENGIDDPENFGFDPLVVPLLKKCEEKVIVIPRRSFSRYVAVAAAIILAFFVVTPMSDKAYKPSLQAGFAPAKVVEQPSEAVAEVCEIAPVADTVTETIITKEVADEVVAEPVEVITENTPMAAEVQTADESVADNVTANENTYCIIVASSPNAQNAQLAIKELSAKKQAEYSVIQCGKRHRIFIGSYSSNSEAGDALSQVKATFPDAWILSL